MESARAVSKSRSLKRVAVNRADPGGRRTLRRDTSRMRDVRRRTPAKTLPAPIPFRQAGRVRSIKLSLDFTLVFIVGILLAFGLIMLYSSSSYNASLLPEADPAFYLKRQLIAVAVGVVAMIVCAQLKRSFWERLAWPAYLFSLGLVMITPIIGREINHAKRWIYIGPVSIQPSELMKIGVILVLARWIAAKDRREMGNMRGIMPIIGIASLPAGLVWVLTSNLSSGIIIFGIAFIMLFIAGPTYKEYITIVAVLVGSAAFLVWYAQTHSLDFLGYRGARIVSWLNPAADSSGSGFQTLQALYAIGSGGLGGKGLGQSMQKLGFLPEAQNDMIFSIICEELGLIGAITIMVLFLALIIKLIGIASQIKDGDMFEMLIVAGVMAHMSLQVLFNIAVVTNTIPNTGISLPFISYGGSAIVCQLAEIGMVLGIERHAGGRSH